MGNGDEGAGRDIVAIGASAGGVDAITRIVAALPENLDAAVFVVVHTLPHGPGYFAALLDRAGPLPAAYPEDGDPIERGRVYVAPPDRHLLVQHGRVGVVRGPKENFTRPAIDPLFRSAALAYGPRVTGVVLTGGLDDGTAGLVAIKARGGIAVVQDPAEAREPSMPRSALEHAAVDHCLPLAAIAPLLAELAGRPAPPDGAYPVPDWIEAEAEIAGAPTMQDRLKMEEIGEPSPLSCPECGGVLYEMKIGELSRFRCRVGHAYSARSLMAEQAATLEATLWAGVRALEESALLLRRLADRTAQRNGEGTASDARGMADERRRQADEMRRFLETAVADASSSV